GINCHPGPHVASARWRVPGSGDVPSLGVDEAPDFIELEALAAQVAKRAILIVGARLSGIHKQFGHGVESDIGQTRRRAKAVALDQKMQNPHSFGGVELVHVAKLYLCACSVKHDIQSEERT